MTASSALHLLWIYESIIAMRPLSRGNHEFLGMLLRSTREIAAYLRRLAHDDSSSVLTLVQRQSITDAAPAAREILNVLKASRGESHSGGRTLYLGGELQPLRDAYGGITVIFGPGLGLGDEITFLGLIRRLRTRYPAVPLKVLNLYPGLWSQLQPGITAHDYRGKPLRPLLEVNARAPAVDHHHLVIVVDFDCYYLHQHCLAPRADQDVVEISLGLRKLWLTRGQSPWTRFASVEPLPFNNYTLVARIADELLGASAHEPAWTALRVHARPRGNTLSVLLNPHSSKPVPYDSRRWTHLLCEGARSAAARLEVTVLPGLDRTSRDDATSIVNALVSCGMTAHLFGIDPQCATPYNTIPGLVEALAGFDMCITIDTFTAHLAPLLGLPTIVMALKHNPQFWVPAPHALYLLPENVERDWATLFARLSGRRAVPPARRSAAAALGRAVDEACQLADVRSFEHIHRALLGYLATLDNEPNQAEGARWLRFWSRTRAALQRERANPQVLAPYPRVFADSTFFKLASCDGRS